MAECTLVTAVKDYRSDKEMCKMCVSVCESSKQCQNSVSPSMPSL